LIKFLIAYFPVKPKAADKNTAKNKTIKLDIKILYVNTPNFYKCILPLNIPATGLC
jgi:hypothetical protein